MSAHIPPEFSNRGILHSRLVLDLPIFAALGVHASLVQYAKNPSLPAPHRKVLEHVMDEMEAGFAKAGLPTPSQGWRGDAPPGLVVMDRQPMSILVPGNGKGHG
jgi:hypothetical protein